VQTGGDVDIDIVGGKPKFSKTMKQRWEKVLVGYRPCFVADGDRCGLHTTKIIQTAFTERGGKCTFYDRKRILSSGCGGRLDDLTLNLLR
jgi:hypothetical protein